MHRNTVERGKGDKLCLTDNSADGAENGEENCFDGHLERKDSPGTAVIEDVLEDDVSWPATGADADDVAGVLATSRAFEAWSSCAAKSPSRGPHFWLTATYSHCKAASSSRPNDASKLQRSQQHSKPCVLCAASTRIFLQTCR